MLVNEPGRILKFSHAFSSPMNLRVFGCCCHFQLFHQCFYLALTLLCLPAGSLGEAQDIITESEKWMIGLKKITMNLTECKRLYLLPEHSSDFQYTCQLICVFHRPACQICWTWKRNFPASYCILSLSVIISLHLFFSPVIVHFTEVQKTSNLKGFLCIRYSTGNLPAGNEVILCDNFLPCI